MSRKRKVEYRNILDMVEQAFRLVETDQKRVYIYEFLGKQNVYFLAHSARDKHGVRVGFVDRKKGDKYDGVYTLVGSFLGIEIGQKKGAAIDFPHIRIAAAIHVKNIERYIALKWPAMLYEAL